jgi:hypothetical protein
MDGWMDGREVVRKQFSVEFQFLALSMVAVVSSFAVFLLPTNILQTGF